MWKNLVQSSNKSHLSKGYDPTATNNGLIGKNYSRWGFLFNIKKEVLKYNY